MLDIPISSFRSYGISKHVLKKFNCVQFCLVALTESALNKLSKMSDVEFEKLELYRYLNTLISKEHNGLIKVITGMRRCGKSYLLFRLFKEPLLSEEVDEDHIIEIAFDAFENFKLLRKRRSAIRQSSGILIISVIPS